VINVRCIKLLAGVGAPLVCLVGICSFIMSTYSGAYAFICAGRWYGESLADYLFFDLGEELIFVGEIASLLFAINHCVALKNFKRAASGFN